MVNAMLYMLVAGLSVAIKMTGSWYEMESSRRELEKSLSLIHILGNVENVQRVSFTVDAYPNDVFEGTVMQIRLGDSESTRCV